MARRPRDHSQAIRITGLSSQRAFNPRWPQAVSRCSAKAPVVTASIRPRRQLSNKSNILSTLIDQSALAVHRKSDRPTHRIRVASRLLIPQFPFSYLVCVLALAVTLSVQIHPLLRLGNRLPRTELQCGHTRLHIESWILRSFRLDKPDYVWEGDQSTATFECIRGALRVSQYTVDRWQ